MQTLTKNFQSYLFIGNNQTARLEEVDKLLTKLGTNRNPNSPDLIIIEPEKNSIGISQIRELKKKIFQKPSLEKFNTVIILFADKLTLESQNSLLKLIEEPPEKAIIIMEGTSKASFIPTLLSRVVIHTVKNIKKHETQYTEISKFKLDELLEIENPEEWLNGQIQKQYFNLLSKPKVSLKQVQKIEKMANTKKMIRANVNSKFALANLFFSENK